MDNKNEIEIEENKCPYCGCGENKAIIEKAFLNAESYGTCLYNLCCENCGKGIEAYIERIVLCTQIIKKEFDIDDFGQEPVK